MLRRLEINVTHFKQKIPHDVDFFRMMERMDSAEFFLLYFKECMEDKDLVYVPSSPTDFFQWHVS